MEVVPGLFSLQAYNKQHILRIFSLLLGNLSQRQLLHT